MFLAPRQLPSPSAMLQDMGNPGAARVAAALGVHERTVYHWLATDQAPRPAALAIFYGTSWGRDLVNCQAVNDARLLATESALLRSQVDRLHGRIAYLERLGGYGTANDPTFEAAPFWPGLRLVR